MMAARAESATGKDDWTGYYAMARGKNLAGFKPINLDLDKAIIAHLQPGLAPRWRLPTASPTTPAGVSSARRHFSFYLEWRHVSVAARLETHYDGVP